MDGAIILGSRGSAAGPGQRAPRARPVGADQRDRHSAPHRRARRPLDSGSGRQRQRGDGRHHRLRRRHEAPAARHRPPARSGQPGTADARALQGAPRRHAGEPHGPRARRRRHDPRRRLRGATRRDGATHLRRDRDDDRRARCRRPPAAPAGRRGLRRDQRRARTGAGRLPAHRQQLGRARPRRRRAGVTTWPAPADPGAADHAATGATPSSSISAIWPSCSGPRPPRSPRWRAWMARLATAVKETLDRITETSILDQYLREPPGQRGQVPRRRGLCRRRSPRRRRPA